MSSEALSTTPSFAVDAAREGSVTVAPMAGAARRVFIENFGCQMNDYDVERMVEVLRRNGFERTDEAEGADLIVINTCSIREKAEHKAASAAGRYKPLKDKNPALVVAIGGCVAQQEGDALLRKIPVADLTFGPDQIPRLAEHVRRINDPGSTAAATGSAPVSPRSTAIPNRYRLRLAKTEVTDVEDYAFLTADPRPGDVSVTALVTIQKGCDNYCAYCVVPNTRGCEVSRPAEEVRVEVERFIALGAREITLIGQNVNAYHAIGTPDGDDFAELLRRINDVPGLMRLRYTTSHPHYFSRKVADAFRDCDKLCPWLHLPVQAGSSSVLSRMAREYTREQYLEKIEYLRQVCPDISLSTDIIVGYPGETEQDFAQTLSLLETVRYDSIYSFAYSRRPGTPAIDLPDDVLADEKSRRLSTVLALQKTITAERLGRMVGRIEPILIEGFARMGTAQLCGRTAGNHTVNIRCEGHEPAALQSLIGQLVPVRITESKIHTLVGLLAS
ncbi:MAG: tRNA (N6-isopentenyl adenosine(37)-C2)-methylthiotransferase MiaB [Myxococcales bacterium]|nr:tRNA (N6-isopentenyl adenosine(37)-C2)-methylthiotransferase MiaB [Myxococcales bacterium]